MVSVVGGFSSARLLSTKQGSSVVPRFMKKFLNLICSLTPHLSLIVPLFLWSILLTLSFLFPDLFCVPVNPGAKEFICGGDYSHPFIRFFQSSSILIWVVLLLIGGAQLIRGKRSWVGGIAWSISAVLLVGAAVLLLTLPVGDPP